MYELWDRGSPDVSAVASVSVGYKKQQMIQLLERVSAFVICISMA